ncbi:MAG: hypothetical protein ACRDTJ_00520, partial [Pseudonocardiaceae bacterium]
ESVGARGQTHPMTSTRVVGYSGDDHLWVQSVDDCPNCQCCSARLCQTAVAGNDPCQWVAAQDTHDLVRNCPCTSHLPQFVVHLAAIPSNGSGRCGQRLGRGGAAGGSVEPGHIEKGLPEFLKWAHALAEQTTRYRACTACVPVALSIEDDAR